MLKGKYTKKRLDLLLVDLSYFSTRSLAQAMILSGNVLIDDHPITKAGTLVDSSANIRIKNASKYVSRAGEKLEKALDLFNINPLNFVCADIGSSTGGFSDCLLQRGAKKIYTIDCGSNQLSYKLRSDHRIVVHENTNARYLKKDLFEEVIDIITVDLSFISIKKVLSSVINATEVSKYIIILIKPQFESQKEDVEKGGIIRKKETHYKTIKDIFLYFKEENLCCTHFTNSPIKGKKGNIEYLALIDIQRKNPSILEEDILLTIDQSFNE